jgi:hypothetical protein
MERLDYDHPDNPPGNRFGRVRWEKTVPKEAMVEIAGKLGIDTSGDKPELRQRIREHSHSHGSEKSPESKLSTNDLLRIRLALNRALRLDASEVDVYDDLPKWGGNLVVTTEEHDELEVEVVDKGKASWKDHWGDEPNYSEYELYKLAGRHFEDGRRHRVMVLHDLDYDQFNYRGSVVLEKQVGYGPYQRWKKQCYVREVMVDDQ